MNLILDAGAFIALERRDAYATRILRHAIAAGREVSTHGGVIGQVWRGGARQAVLARHLHGVEVVPLDQDLGRAAGWLLGKTKTSDVIDAALVLLAHDDDIILTSDVDDLLPLAEALGMHIELFAV